MLQEAANWSKTKAIDMQNSNKSADVTMYCLQIRIAWGVFPAASDHAKRPLGAVPSTRVGHCNPLYYGT